MEIIKKFAKAILIWTFSLLIIGCGHVTHIKNSYTQETSPSLKSQKSSSPAKTHKVNGAEITAKLEPTKTSGAMSVSALIYFYGRAREVGPYKIIINALGKPENHEYMAIDSVSYRIDDGKIEKVPERFLFKDLPFWPFKNPTLVGASYKCPALLPLSFKQNKKVAITARIKIKTKTNVQSRTITFNFVKSEIKENEFISIPKEIFKAFRKKDN